MKQGYGGYGKDLNGPYFSVTRNSQRNVAWPLFCPTLPYMYYVCRGPPGNTFINGWAEREAATADFNSGVFVRTSP